MDFQWMEDIPWLQKVKNAIDLRHRTGDLLYWLPRTGIVQKAGQRKKGISVYMVVKDEAQWIEPTIRSLAPFVEQFSFIDNGSSDETVNIIRRVADDLSLDHTLEIHPKADFGEARDYAVRNTTCSWILRWDGDIICRTQGQDTFQKIRDFIFSLNQECFYAVYIPLVQLDGDLLHQNRDRLVFSEDWLVTYSPLLYHTRTGRMRELRYPFYYKRIYFWAPVTFHIWGLDSPEKMVERSYLEEWRKLNDFKTFPTRKSYAESHIRHDYGTDSLKEAGALYCRERFTKLVPYDEQQFGEYPEMLRPYLEIFPLRIIYRNGVIAGRSDFMDILDRLDSEKKRMTVDVIVPTMNREDIVVATVQMLLEQDYPDFRIIVSDQSDTPSARLRELSSSEKRLLYHMSESRGLPASRNEALALSTADIILFVDDDVIPEKGLIEGHVLAYINAGVGATAGKVFDNRPYMMKPVAVKKIGSVNFWTGDVKRGFVIDSFLTVDSAHGCNMSFRRDVLVEAGGFDNRFGGTALLEETDVFLTLKENGYKIRYTPHAFLTHIGATLGGCRTRDPYSDIYWYAHNHALLFLKHFPWYVFPCWITIRIGKFVRDSARMLSLMPLIKGLKGMLDGYRAFRIPREKAER
ncbi:glycosyltransferase [bacterium]|nr:glycosyltransferase [bacterium]